MKKIAILILIGIGIFTYTTKELSANFENLFENRAALVESIQ